MEEEDEEQHKNNNNTTISSSHYSMMTNNSNDSSPLHSINTCSFSPPPQPPPSHIDSPTSPLSSDHSSNGFFSPRHHQQDQQHQHDQHHQSPSNSPDHTTTKQKKHMNNNNNISSSSLSPHLSPVFIPSKSVRDKPAVMTKVNDSNSEFDFSAVPNNGRDSLDGGGELRGSRKVTETAPPVRTIRTMSLMGEIVKRKAFLGFRICGMILCLISFSVMATDKHQGWALDSFDRYKELRYCMAVNVIGFVYSAAQATVVVYDLATGNYKPHNTIRIHFDFFMDQVLSYLLISASSSAATRVEDWTSNWGKDKFTQTATASIILSFLAFVALALSSLLSGFTLFTLRSAS